MRKTIVQRNFLTIYVRQAYKPIVEKFFKLISKDKEIKSLADKKQPDNYTSVAIVYLMDKYNQEKEEGITETNINSGDNEEVEEVEENGDEEE